MKPSERNIPETERRELLEQLSAAEAALCANLNLNCKDVTARVHMQRALAHIQEAAVAVRGLKRARKVRQLLEDLQHEDLRQQPAYRPAIRPGG